MASVYHLGGRNGFAGWQWYVRPVDSVRCGSLLRQVIYNRWSYLPSRCYSGFLLLTRCARNIPCLVFDQRGKSVCQVND